MAAKKRKLKQALGVILPMALMALVGAAAGYLGAELLLPSGDGRSLGERLRELGWILIALGGSIWLQTILHEAGHLVFGLASGYRFVSFRIGSLMWQKDGGKLRFCRFQLAGTGGQCLMAPPDLTDGKMLYKLYNLGGVLMNLIVSVLAAGLAVLFWNSSILRVFFALMVLMGVATALTNGIPLRVGGVDNDGRNALMLGKDPAALRALWVQLSINEQQAMGRPLHQMPEEWFDLPTGGMDNPLVATQAVMRENWLMDQHRFGEAAALTDWLETQTTGLAPLYQSLLLCDRLICALLQVEDAAALLKRWNSKANRSFRKQAGTLLTVLRTEYAVALLAAQDEAAADRFLQAFEKQAEHYPMKADVESERALMVLAAQMAAKR